MLHKKSYPALLLFAIIGCTVTSAPHRVVQKGQAIAWKDAITRINAATKSKVRFERITAADWEVERGGLINLKHPKAVAAGLKPGMEPIQIYFYVIDHPVHGRFIVDTGMGQAFRQKEEEWPVSGIIRKFMHTDKIKVHQTLREFNTAAGKEPAGVFLTHLHLDHIMGTADVPLNVPVYVGPRESTARHFQNMVVQGSTDRLLGAGRTLEALSFPNAPTGANSGLAVLDFFGDGTLYVLHAPGHTPGSLAFVVVSETGKHLVLGDNCHTRWGWENGVTPGDFTSDQVENARSLEQLKALSTSVGPIQVYPGHQSL